jgi:hypothetical protein
MEITEAEAREVLWASSEEGKAQLAAAWKVACRLDIDITRADVGALLWAAHEAKLPPAPPQDPRKARMLELIEERGEQGATIRLVAIWLSAEGKTTKREALHRWSREFEADGLLERGGAVRGSFRMVKR